MKRFKKSSFVLQHFFRLSRLGISFFLGRVDRFALSVRLTDRCQLSCAYCRRQEVIRDIDPDELKSFLKYFRKRGLFYIILTGGEPFLYPNIEKLIRFLKYEGFYIVMNTNGQAINNEKYRGILKKMDEIVVSIDGPEKENDKNRGRGSFKNALNTIEYLYHQNKKIVLSTVLTKNNLKDSTLRFFLRLKRRFNVILDFGIVSPYMFGTIKDSIVSEDHQQKLFIKKLLHFKKKYNITELSKRILEYQMSPYKISCMTARHTLYIDVDGNVFPCVYGIGKDEMLLGNINDPENLRADNIDCDICYCQSLLALNLLSENKSDFRSLLRWLG